MLNIVNPNAAVIVWNYVDRMVSSENNLIGDPVESEKINLSDSIVSIKTNKTKSSPAGAFEIVLAPTTNWLTRLTAGSWLCILMGQTPINQLEIDVTPLAEHIKFLGRIETVRVTVGVNPETGARETYYIVAGKDWGGIFESILYADPVLRDILVGSVGVAAQYMYADRLKNETHASSTDNVAAIVNIWGSQFGGHLSKHPRSLKPHADLTLPTEVTTYLRIIDRPSNRFADLIQIIAGKLASEDTINKSHTQCYEDVTEAVGIIRPDSILMGASLWQVLSDSCNDILNELTCDLRIEGSLAASKTSLALYKRIKPFTLHPLNPNLVLTRELISEFKNIRTTILPLEHIINVNAGTNWRDKVNFAEIMFDSSLVDDKVNAAFKFQAQVPDASKEINNAWHREGFKPMLLVSRYFPVAPGTSKLNLPKIVDWKYFIKEWYFNTHNMFNGSITVVGQDQYIQVGDNIMFSTDAFSSQNTTNIKDVSLSKIGETFILAHVESVSHQFSVNADGTRSFFTSIVTDSSKTIGLPPFDDGMDSSSTSRLNFPVNPSNVVNFPKS
jgi:hypothetical protein